MKKKINSYLKKKKEEIKKILSDSKEFNTEPPKSVLNIVGKMHFYSFITFIIALLILIIKIIQIIFKINWFMQFEFIYILLIISLTFYILKRMYVKAFNDNKFEIINGLVLKKKKNKFTRRRWIIFKTEDDIEREIDINKRTKLKKGGIYEFCITRPSEDRKEMLVSAEFIGYKDLSQKEFDEEIIEEE